MKKQYVVLKYVQADSVAEALKKAMKTPVSECYLHGGWFDKDRNFNFFDQRAAPAGFRKKSAA